MNELIFPDWRFLALHRKLLQCVGGFFVQITGLSISVHRDIYPEFYLINAKRFIRHAHVWS